MSIHPNGPTGPRPFPTARRHELFPIKENDDVTMVPRALKQSVERAGKTPAHLADMSVRELATLMDKDGNEVGIGIAPEVLVNRAELAYRETVQIHANVAAMVRLLERERETSRETGISGFSDLFAIGEMTGARDNSDAALHQLREYLGVIEDDLYGPIDAETKKRSGGLRDRIRKAYRDLKDRSPDAKYHTMDEAYERGAPSPYDALFGLIRRGDALKKYASYRDARRQIDAAGEKERVLQGMAALRLRAEKFQVPSDPPRAIKTQSVETILLTELRSDVEALAARCLAARVFSIPESLSQPEALEAVSKLLARALETTTVGMLRDSRAAFVSHRATLQEDLARRLSDPRNNELAQLVQEREIGTMLTNYWKHNDTFIPVGEIAEDLATLRDLVLAPGGKVARVILYGPPGTGKTEQLRQIAKDNGQKCRVISVHESSSFETLVGMHQLPLPRAETMRDADAFWSEIQPMETGALAAYVAPEILSQFAGLTVEEKASDFKRWYKMKLDLARTVAAIGAVAPDDPRVAKARQEALAAWLDQPLSEGLRDGDIIVLDEIDKAGKGLEGVFDLLTRRPGQEFHPAGRTEPFRIHPDARVVATTNYGDAQTERSGGGDLPPAIVNRFPEKRKVGFLQPETELKLLEIMTTPPESPKLTLLSEQEYKMAAKLISYVLPRLRTLYLRPGDLTFISPISVRTLENICAHIVDQSTRSRALNSDGKPRHFLEAAWDVLTAGPWKDEEAPKIKEMIFTMFADSGVFNELNETDAEPKYLVASHITGIAANKTLAKIATAGLRNPATKLPANFSMSRKVVESGRAPAVALYEPLLFTSSRLVESDEEISWRRAIEDEGGDPETQSKLDQATAAWLMERKGITEDVQKNEAAYMAADLEIVRRHFGSFVTAPDDVQVFLNRMQENAMRERSPEEFARVGIAINALIQSACEREVKNGGADFTFALDLTAVPPLDWLGHGHKAGTLQLAGRTGKYTAREMSGGTVEVKGEAGDNFAYSMRGGKAKASKVGGRAFQRMSGGDGEVDEAGDRFGFCLEGGTIYANVAGARAGNQAKFGEIFVGQAGVRMGEQSEPGVTIHVESQNTTLPGSQVKAKIIVGKWLWDVVETVE